MFDIRLVDLENTGHMLNTPDAPCCAKKIWAFC